MSRWSAPVDRWVRCATTRDGKPLSFAVRLLLDHLWSLADAPSKRSKGHAFIHGQWVTSKDLAEDLACSQRYIERMFAVLREEGLAKRGEGTVDGKTVTGIWLADEPGLGRFETNRSPERTIGQSPNNSSVTEQTVGDQSFGHHPTNRSVTTRPIVRSPPDQSFGHLKEDPIIPDQDPILTRSEGGDETWTLVSPGEPTPKINGKRRKDEIVTSVIAHLNAVIAECREWTGLDPPGGITLTKTNRAKIEACLADVEGGFDDKLQAARKVIDVQAAQVRSLGKLPQPITPEAKKSRLAEVSWRCFKIGSLFRRENFSRWLERWSPTGDHEIWGDRPKPNGRGTNQHRAGYGAIAEQAEQVRKYPDLVVRVDHDAELPPLGEDEIPF